MTIEKDRAKILVRIDRIESLSMAASGIAAGLPEAAAVNKEFAAINQAVINIKNKLR